MNIQKPSFCRWPNRRGSILIIVFWAISFLASLAIPLGVMARQKIAMAARLGDRAQLRLIAGAGARKAIALLREPDSDALGDSLTEPWAQAEGLRDVSLGAGLFSVDIVDEERKINLNTASVDILKNLFKAALECSSVEAEALAHAIVDWRDSDSLALAQGAEDNYYEGLAYPYGCKDAPLDILDELLLVRGITATIYQKIRGVVTLTGSGIVNINTAPKVVILALGLDEKLADKILNFRAGDDGLEGTSDDRSFAQTGSLASELSLHAALDENETAKLTNLAAGGLIGVTSLNFFITSRSRFDQKKGTARVECVLERIPLEAGSGYRVKIRYWHLGYEV